MEYIIESDVIIRAVDKPFSEKQIIASFPTLEMAFAYVQKYLDDTKNLHTYFARQYICESSDLDERVKEGRLIAINVVLGQFEDMIYIRLGDPDESN